MSNASLPPAVTETLAMLSSPVLVITTHAQGRNNGLTAGSHSLATAAQCDRSANQDGSSLSAGRCAEK